MFNKLVRNSRSLLILGVLLAVIAFVLAFVVLSKAQNSPAGLAAAQPTPVPAQELLVNSQLPALTQIVDLQTARQYFHEQPVTASIPADYVQGFNGLHDLIAQGPRHLAVNLPKGETLLTTDLISNTAPGTVDYSPLLNKGEVAETISVPSVSAAGNGNIQVSDRVDMLVTYKLPLQETGTPPRLPGIERVGPPANTWETQTTLENLRVLNVASGNYTLAVTHQDALLLKWVKDTSGTVDLVVRAADDTPAYFQTTPILPDYLTHATANSSPFIEP